MAPWPLLILRPVRHKSTNLPSSAQAWPGGAWGGWCGAPPRCPCAGLCRVGAGRHLGVCTEGPMTIQGCGPPQPKPLPVARPPAPGSTPKGAVRIGPVCLPVSPSGPFPGALFPGSPLLHCVRAWGLRSRYTYSFCLCAIISVSGGAGWSWAQGGGGGHLLREALSLALLL